MPCARDTIVYNTSIRRNDGQSLTTRIGPIDGDIRPEGVPELQEARAACLRRTLTAMFALHFLFPILFRVFYRGPELSHV